MTTRPTTTLERMRGLPPSSAQKAKVWGFLTPSLSLSLRCRRRQSAALPPGWVCFRLSLSLSLYLLQYVPFSFAPEKLKTTKPRRHAKTHSTNQADAFSLPDDEHERENGDDSEFVYEKITLLTADGVVVLPGRKLRRSSLDGGSIRARWRREAEERRRREQREAARRSGRSSFPVVPPVASAERSAAVKALEATLPGTWARGSSVSASASDEAGDSSSFSSSSPSGLLVFASPFAVSASNGVDRGCVFFIIEWTFFSSSSSFVFLFCFLTRVHFFFIPKHKTK